MQSPVLEFSIQPRFYETDALGHINNVAITGWLELGRTQLIRHLATGQAALPPESWVVVSVLIEFAAETFYGSDVTLRITELAFGNTSLTVHCELFQEAKLTVRGKSVLVYRDAATGEKRPIPQALKDAYMGTVS